MRGRAMLQMFKSCVQDVIRDDRGSTAMLFALMLVPVTVSVGLSVDFGRANRTQAEMQSALDTAAIAVNRAPPAVAEQVGLRFFNANFKNDLTTAPVVNFDVRPDGQVLATARGSLPMLFGGLLGIATFEISTKTTVVPEREVAQTGTSEVVFEGGAPCLHVMDQSNQDALKIDSSVDLDASGCDVRVRSNRSRALYELDGQNIAFRSIQVKGEASTTDALKITGHPYEVKTNADVVANPYMDAIRDVVQVITVGACTSANTDKTWTGTVAPGTYCGATTFRNAVFSSGLYIIKSSSGNKVGALKLDGNLDGSAGVTFYLADNKSTLAGYTASSGSVLKAPSTGTTRGLLLFENSNRGANWPVTINEMSGQVWEGLIYLPSANLTLASFENWTTFDVSMSANTVVLDRWSNMTWRSFKWTPFNRSNPIVYDDETFTDQTTTIVEKPLYIAQ
jgi:Flp pilus assembly protein TadG